MHVHILVSRISNTIHDHLIVLVRVVVPHLKGHGESLPSVVHLNNLGHCVLGRHLACLWGAESRLWHELEIGYSVNTSFPANDLSSVFDHGVLVLEVVALHNDWSLTDPDITWGPLEEVGWSLPLSKVLSAAHDAHLSAILEFFLHSEVNEISDVSLPLLHSGHSV